LNTTAAKYDEATLVDLLKKKDRQVFSYLYDNYSAVLYGIILKVVIKEETANDILQDVFVKIWKNIESYDTTKGRLYTWMLNIARNTAIDFLRSKQFQKESKNQNIEDSVNTINQKENSQQQIDTIGVASLVEKLPPDQKNVIDLVYFKGYTQDEASKELNIPLGTVKTRIRTAIIALRGVFKE
jgi:RNA polymerase sigma-70 factor (ECF subfamily)